MSRFAIGKSKVFYVSWVVIAFMRVGVFLILLTLLAPIAYAHPTPTSEQFERTPSELSFGVNTAFVRAMTDGAEDASNQWLVYMPSMCGQTEETLRNVLSLPIDSIEQPNQIPGSFILHLDESRNIRSELLSTDEVVRFAIIQSHK